MKYVNLQFLDYAKRDDLDSMKLLSVDQETMNQTLIVAAARGYEEIVRYLLMKGVDIDTKDNNKNTALFWANREDRHSIVRLLIDNGANINIQNSNESTVLHRAAELGELDDVKYFIDQGANVEIKECHGRTALDCAILNGHYETVEFLENYPKQLAEQRHLEDLIDNKAEHNGVGVSF